MIQPPPLPPAPPINPYAAPVARVDDFVGEQLVLADRGIRLVAAIADTVILYGLVAIVAIIAAIALPALQKNPQGEETAIIVLVGVAVLAMLALMTVNLVLLHRHGQTIGKRLLGIKIVRVDGNRCSLPRIIFARILPTGLLKAIPLLGYLFVLLDPLLIFGNEQRCLHDLIADTIVVKA